MEARAEYLGRAVERPRLTVVRDAGESARYSALPHAVLFSDLSHGAIRVFAVLQAHWWGPSGECTASHATLAAEARCSLRSLRRFLDELIAASLIEEGLAGVRREKVYRPVSIGQKRPIETVGNETPVADCEPVNRPKTTVQSAKNDTVNRPKTTHSYKKTKGKKTKEENKNTAPTEPARSETRSGRVLDVLKAADVPVTMRPQDHRALKESGADPDLVAEAYGAIFRGEWGDEFMRQRLTVQSAIGHLAGYQSWRREAMPAEHVNGTASKLEPATDEDRTLWGRAVELLGATMNQGNVEAHIAPLTVGGRLEDGGLCLIVPPGVEGEHLKRMRSHISRALEDAGDANPSAVRFKARKPKGRNDAE